MSDAVLLNRCQPKRRILCLKNMRRNLIIAFALLLSAFGCNEGSEVSCVRGTIIGYEQCSNAALIRVEDQHQIGKELQFYDKVSYDNVVRAPGEFGQYGTSTIYFQYRSFDRDRDQELFSYSASPCLAIYAPLDVPTIVITNYALNPCSDAAE